MVSRMRSMRWSAGCGKALRRPRWKASSVRRSTAKRPDPSRPARPFEVWASAHRSDSPETKGGGLKPRSATSEIQIDRRAADAVAGADGLHHAAEVGCEAGDVEQRRLCTKARQVLAEGCERDRVATQLHGHRH